MPRRVPVLASAAAAALIACHGAGAPRPAAPATAAVTPAARAAADSGRPPYAPADLRFMSGMISHHAQAVVMAGWAASHGASPTVRNLCERIVVSQRDEIAFMQRWLRERHEPVPAADGGHAMAGMDHPMLMPGMLTAEQMARLDAARGVEFDRLFLEGMIQHHRGAITMVNELFASEGAGQDDSVYKFAADVNADQAAEINRMGLMLAALPGPGR